MKYLLQAIEAKRASVKLGDLELRQLLTEVCKGRDEREEFLESIERIVTELKNYSEHSTAFLSKVSKRDAPDYYDVIKHPMDLGTMQKKVKAGQYKTKRQFGHDLNLIWDNCLIYNSDPSHPLRRNVAFMRKKADHLLEFISDKSDVKDALVQWGVPATATVEVGEPGTPAPEATTTAEKEVKKRRSRWEEGKFEEQDAFVRTPQSMMEFSRIDAGLNLIESGVGAGPSSRPMLMAPVEAMDRIKTEEEDPLSVVLGSIFTPLLGEKGKEKATPEPQPQSPPPSRGQSQSASTPAPSTAGADLRPLDASADWFTVTASHQLMSAALPALPSSSLLSQVAEDRGKKRKKPHHAVPATRRKGLQGRIARNIRTLHKVQSTHSKFLSLAHFVENEAPIPSYLTSMSSDEESDYPSDDDSPPTPPSAPRHPLSRISPTSAHDHASYNVRTLLAHAGFEGGHRVAVDVLTDALTDFLGSLGRMLRTYADRYAHTLSAEEMILHTLQESAGASVASLENYIRNDVERYGAKMGELLRKLRVGYRDQFERSTERGVVEDEALFAGDGEALVAGGWAEELGDDFFGFRELGLDREMSGLTVPSRLFYGKAGRAAANRVGAEGGKTESLPYPPPPAPIELVSAAVGAQIGLLHGFYTEKLREHRQRVKQEEAHTALREKEEGEEEEEKRDPVVVSNTLPEGEQEKQRYKVPPTGKMPRRILWSGALERKVLMEREMERVAAAAGVANGGVGAKVNGKEGAKKKGVVA
ncbi:Bromodomain transcription factor [Kalmanozyma brasiliensis GHG001]|uniref:Bromo domain-containing protein n=1 Tax=Kalmanozyma brasiliensis (strain GHG001) TaxID=1365824 RepID=V5EVC4_KALBG|nr:Bromodomain transcription factor [Kalmanozyma brasiliensis GHG001]EST09420.1 Bromodomain transcription factor [Kalmanozyma brasiliensis GHG001]